MWRSLWRTIDRFSLPHFKYVIEELQAIKVINKLNRESVIDMMQSVVEIVTYGDRHDPAIFECFMEYQVMSEFVRLLKISRTSRIEAPLLQYLSIMIQNLQSDQAIFYCFSNDYLNIIITHQYNFDGGDVLQYYISFLRAVSCKVNKDTLCLLVNVSEDAVVSFPLYTEALKFALHREKMIQTAVRALTLNIYCVSDAMVCQFVTTTPNAQYFSDLTKRLGNQCFKLDAIVQTKDVTRSEEIRKELLHEADKIVDDLYYLNDILSSGPSHLSCLINERLLHLLIFPIMLSPVRQSSDYGERSMSTITSLYIICRILQVLGVKDIINSVAGCLLYPYVISSAQGDSEDGKDYDHTFSMSQHSNEIQNSEETSFHFKGVNHVSESGLICKYFELFFPASPVDSSLLDGIQRERAGLLSNVFSGNHHLLLATLFLLIILAESKELDYKLAAILRAPDCEKIKEASASPFVDQSLLEGHMDQIVNSVLKILGSQPPFPVTVQWHTGWLLRKLLTLQENKLNDINIHLLSTSYRQSCDLLRKELHGCWLDYIPETFKTEWPRCVSALEVSSHNKDAIFTLELDLGEESSDGAEASFLAWRNMVDAIKVFVLHVQLKAIMRSGHIMKHPLASLKSSITAISGIPHASDFTTTCSGSELALGSAVPCKIAFSNFGQKDIYLIAAASGTSGKLFLLDRHPLRSHRGITFATAPLAGSSPKIDPSHPTWLHLRIRAFEPKFDTKRQQKTLTNNTTDGRWTLGFPNAEACEFARLYILDEIRKQRSAVENLLAPLLQDDFFAEDQTPNSNQELRQSI